MKRRQFGKILTASPFIGMISGAHAATQVLIHEAFGSPMYDLETTSGGTNFYYVSPTQSNVNILAGYISANIWPGISIQNNVPNGYISVQHGTAPATRRQCVALVRACSNAGLTSGWRRGNHVEALAFASPLVIATFSSKTSYYGHTAILLDKTQTGIWVLDQNWHNGNSSTGMDGILSIHFLKFLGNGNSSRSNASRYYVVEQ